MKGIRILWILPSTWYLLQIILVQSQDTSGTCGEFTFQCDSGQCVSSSVQCDGAKDCEDGSDETAYLCRLLDLKCSAPSLFRCAYGACVDKDKLCNGIRDCADNSDEMHPDCFKDFRTVKTNLRCDPIYNFTCHSGECVDSTVVCDGRKDCLDASDETLTECFNMTCQPYSFQCAYGACVDGDTICNGTEECIDGSDELPAYCTGYKQRGSTVENGIGCTLPEQPSHGRYKIAGCEPTDNSEFCESEPGSIISLDTQLIYECKRGYNLPVSPDGSPVSDTYCMEDYTTDEPQGGWNNKITCQKNCPPVFSETMELECDFYGKKVPCDKARQGTILKARCKPFFHPQEPVTVYDHTMCLDTGKWRDPLYKCVPVCGIAGNATVVHFIANGETARIGDHPWAISLYRKEKENFYRAMCGGTIISYNLVLTAAHCIFDEDTGDLVPASRFEVVMGKLNISWDSQEPTQQKIGVKELVWPTSYKGAYRKYERDIAVLVLVRSIQFSSFTMPACIDWKKKGVIHNGEPGNIAGWGMDRTQQPSPMLQSAKLPYKDLETCRKDFSSYNLITHGHQTAYNDFLTYDKICAGTDDDDELTTSVQSGDSGGGLTIIRNNQHFLIGILSAHQKRNNMFAAYTSVAEYIDWLSNNKFSETLT